MADILLIDTQEQRPLQFGHLLDPQVFSYCKPKKLKTGDYSVAGHEDMICVERKSLTDLVSTVIHDWARFTKECRRMAAMDAAIIAVEANFSDLMNKKYEADVDPMSVVGKINTIFIRFGIATVFLSDREQMAIWVYNFLKNYLDEQ